ncbi:ABC transporter permease [Cohnella candidum]|uniref:Ribose ABC transporter permease n=1 Tax=Cohnella candidum TaxID=2674991 RepID=A0A3G3K327_9BACL|nr:ribose ABC transporter permease [Cohnella candidum]AYQ74955.1 ribose ABC transporter permease [Cohnella candidum]
MKRLNNQLPLITLIILVIVGSFLSDSFLTVKNLINLIQFAAETGIIAVGMAFVIFTGGIDLSVGSTVALAAVIAASTQQLGVPGVLGLCVVLGALIGIINGLVITKARVEPFMATLAMMAIVRAVTLWITNGGPVLKPVSASYQAIAGDAFGIPLPAIYLVVIFILGYILLRRLPFGRHVMAVGGGEETARLFGVKVEKVKLMVYTLSGILAALAGALITARIGMGEPRSGQSFELTAIAIVIVGGTYLLGGRGTIGGTFIGAMIFAVILNLMNLLDVSAYIQPIVRGLIIIIAALLISRSFAKNKKTAESA